ncbi:xanthine dehydrogenase family protein molybdopterin-binding subunit [Pseudonocardia acidicola]|uniref:Xanthine dehydrogenase family protein molybdopterin-binding subunit n=1 Tax=Pseudonocardia acidicola TaxID=2724939 RepID=A0ABX1SHJ6_9PSEU|nr:xanthine dehydrogenase family protein molybdopterin-binding subunit [Pseudonocardia acidicola]NMH99948.1 xanthine dehydrogenase family protein molybdopterin-binding subunit [Pseudonocardia acidicola]
MTGTTSVLGQRFVRGDGLAKVTGEARYTADLAFTGLLHAKFVYAGRPHARILSIDTSEAARMPGVHAVLTQADAPMVRYGMFVKDRTLFAHDVVRFEAEIVAAIAADTAEHAAAAAAAVRVEYEDLASVLDVEAALDPAAPLLHPQWEGYQTQDGVDRGSNDCGHMTSVKGDVTAGFAEAELQLTETYRTDMVHAVPIEPHAVVAQWQGEKVTIWSTSQVPFPARAGVAETLQIPQSDVRIVVPHLGGGFGGKCDFHFEAHVALLSKVTRRPVRLVFTRREEFVATDKVRHGARIELTTGLKQDGTITARQARLLLDSGAYCGDALFATEIGLMMIAGPYRIPNLHAEVHTLYTNRTPAGSVRAPGGPQTCWAVEQHTDELARLVGLDPLEFRRRNLVRAGDTGQTGQRFVSSSAHECLERAADLAGWPGTDLGPDEALGIAVGWWFSLSVPSGAYLKLNPDGTGTIITGAQENGSGSVMGLPLLAAEELGMRPESFSVLYQDTDSGPFDIGSAGSQTTFNNGRAVMEAAREVREKLLEVAADRLEIDRSDLELVNGSVRVKGAPSRSLSFAELAAGTQLIGSGSGTPPPLPEHNLSGCSGRLGYSAFAAPSFFCHIARVRVDRETGVVTVPRVVAVHEFGRVLNPIGAQGQVEGGVIQAVGMALLEGSQYDGGHQLNPGLLGYKLVTAPDAPTVTVQFLDDPVDQGGPHGAKAVGEPPVVGTPAAIGNAIAEATGRRVRALPMNAERVWMALHESDATPDAAEGRP